jgi:hypothetical protein
MIADNTGFSTGLRTDQNDVEGSFDPVLFFTDRYAIDEATYSTLMKNGMRYFQYRAGLI